MRSYDDVKEMSDAAAVVGVHHVHCDGGAVSHRWHCCSSSCVEPEPIWGDHRCRCEFIVVIVVLQQMKRKLFSYRSSASYQA